MNAIAMATMCKGPPKSFQREKQPQETCVGVDDVDGVGLITRGSRQSKEQPTMSLGSRWHTKEEEIRGVMVRITLGLNMQSIGRCPWSTVKKVPDWYKGMNYYKGQNWQRRLSMDYYVCLKWIIWRRVQGIRIKGVQGVIVIAPGIQIKGVLSV